MKTDIFARFFRQRFLFGAALITALVVLLAGCGGANQPVSIDPGFPPGDGLSHSPENLTPQVFPPDQGDSPPAGDMPGGEPGGAGPLTEMPPELPPEVPLDAASLSWLDYQNDAFSFALKYPSIYVIMPKPEPAKQFVTPLEVVMFQDENIAKSAIAKVAPPAFAVRVFDNPQKLTAAQWLVQNQIISQDAAKDLKNIVVDNVAGVQNCSRIDIAPNCLIYIPFKGRLYEITPNGEYNQNILENFRFLNK